MMQWSLRQSKSLQKNNFYHRLHIVKIWQVVDLYNKIFWFVSVFFLLFICLCFTVCAAEPPRDLSAEAFVLMSADTHEVLCAKNAHEQRSMASTTKIMTALVALEHGIPEQQIKVTSEMVRVEGTSIGLLPDDLITVRTLVSGMLLESGNDAANVTAYAVAGSQEKFLAMMNQKAAELGMHDTHFETVSGLDSENHYSTAYDMALLGAAAIENAEFRKICGQKSERVLYGNPPYARTLSNHNRLLSEYPGVFGIKTGFTKKSGRCLVTAAERDGVTLVAVTLRAPNDWADHRKLLDYGFSVMQKRDYSDFVKNLTVPVVGGTESTVPVCLYSAASLPIADVSAELQVEVFLRPFLYAPISADKCVGTAVYKLDGKPVREIPLIVSADVPSVTTEQADEAEEPSLFQRIKNFFARSR